MPTRKTAKQIDIADFLNQQHLCESLTLNEVKTLMELTEPVFVNKNEIIADIGEVGEALFFIIKGEVSLHFDDHGKDMEIGRLKEGEVMGEMSFFDRQARSARIRAKGADTRLLKLSRVMYKRLRVEHPYIAVNLLEHAIISLDHLFRRLSMDIASFNQYMYGNGPIR
jgi:CRP-like cAMP-binding protein